MIAARPGQSDLSWNVTLITHREVAIVQLELVAVTELDEAFDRGFDEPNSTVVAVRANVLGQLFHGSKSAAIFLAEDDFDVLPFVQDDLGPEVFQGAGDCLAEIAVRRITDQSGSGVRTSSQQFHESPTRAFAHARAERFRTAGQRAANSTKAWK